MSMRMRRKRNFDERMAACGNLLLAKGTAGILNMKEAAENYRALIDFSAAFGNGNPTELEIGESAPRYEFSRAGKDEQRDFNADGARRRGGRFQREISEYPRGVSAVLYSRNFAGRDLSEFFDAAAETRLCDAAAYASEFSGKIQKITQTRR